MGTPTTFKLGAWNALTDTFVAHPASPTGGIIDLNDGVTWIVLDPGQGKGEGINYGFAQPDVYTSTNARTVGERVTRINYGKKRTVAVQLMLGPLSSYTALSTALHNLQATLAGISQYQPAAIQMTVTGASTPVYMDVLEAHMAVPYRELLQSQLLVSDIYVEFTCRPFLRGARQYLQNLVVNPGFEAPSAPAIQVFNDTFTNFNAYSVQAGGALTQDSTYYVDVALTDTPIRYYRLDETSGTTAYDIGSSPQNGTTHGSPTQGVSGLLNGDTDTCYTFASASSQYVSAAGTGLPSGAGAFTVEAWIKFASNPASNAYICTWGNATTASQNVQLWLSSTGAANFATTGTSAGSGSGALTTGTRHHVVGTYDGTALRLYVDGSLVGGPTNVTLAIPSSPSFAIGTVSWSPGSYFNGQIDEVAVYSGALSAARITAHYNAGNNAPGSQSSTMVIPSGGRVSFGSPSWGSMNLWETRFRYLTGGTYTFYLHYTDASNNLSCVVTQTTLTLNQTVGGVTHQIAQQTGLYFTNGVPMWLEITQFPTTSGICPTIQAVIYADSLTIPTSTVRATVGGGSQTFDAVTALVGQPQIAASGAALPMGGNVINGHAVFLFRPGGWNFSSSGTGIAAWGTDTATTYPNGPVTSFHAARMYAAPAGTLDTAIYLYSGGVITNTSAVPVATAGDVIQAACALRSSGLGNGATVSLVYAEYDGSGSFLRGGTLQTLTISGGVQIAWPAAGASSLSGSWTTGASCAYVDLRVRVQDTVAGNSAGASVWVDNFQAWDQTVTGAATMPYCELRFPQSPAQLVVSGLLGDVPAPAMVAFGTFLTSWAPGASLTFALGRRGYVSASGVFYGFLADVNAGYTQVLSNTSYGGFYSQMTNQCLLSMQTGAMSPADTKGAYRLLARAYCAATGSFLTGVECRAVAYHGQYPYISASVNTYAFYNPWLVNPFNASSTWQIVDTGFLNLPPNTQGGLVDASQNYVVINPSFFNPLGLSGAVFRIDSALLLPSDGATLAGTVYNPSNAVNTVTNQYLWLYADGSGVAGGKDFSWTWSVNTPGLALPSTSIGGPGTTGTGYINVNPSFQPFMTLDPTLRTSVASVNQIPGMITDNNGSVLPLFADIIYSPLYLLPL